MVAGDPFSDFREVSYDYAGLQYLPRTRLAARPFAVLLICGTRDTTIPCRHAEQIYRAASGPKELWVVNGAEHASALGQAPAEY